MRRRRYVWRVEAYLSLHNQTEDGYVVRFVKTRDGRRVYDVNKYFSRWRYGSHTAALKAARSWKAGRVDNHRALLKNGRARG